MLLKEPNVDHGEPSPTRGGDFRRPEHGQIARQSGSVKSAVRALEVIELFSVYREPLSVNAVADVLGMPQSSASTLLKSLHDAGFVDRDPQSRLYMPSLRSVFLGNWAHDLLFHDGSLLQALDQLCHTTGCNVRLAVRNGIFTRYTHVSRLHHDTGEETPRPGSLVPLCHDAIGAMLLVGLPDNDIRDIVRHANAVGDSGRPKVDVQDFLRCIEQCRADGYAESGSLDEPDARMLAVCLPSGPGIPAVIGLSTSPKNFGENRDAILDVLRETISGFQAAKPHGESNELRSI